MLRGFIRPATLDDANYIAPRLREADKAECDASLACPAEWVLPQFALHGYRCWAFGLNDGTPVGLFGVDPAPGAPQVGIAWACSTPVVTQYKYDFLRRSPEILGKLHAEFPILTNTVDARNTLHHRWLRWLGFSFLREFPTWGARNLPFYEFARLRTCAWH